MAEPARRCSGRGCLPLRSLITGHPIATFLLLAYATITALPFVPKEPGHTSAGLLRQDMIMAGDCDGPAVAAASFLASRSIVGWLYDGADANVLIAGLCHPCTQRAPAYRSQTCSSCTVW
jgi:hypothetical protein